jgi:hypothetical protein
MTASWRMYGILSDDELWRTSRRVTYVSHGQTWCCNVAYVAKILLM